MLLHCHQLRVHNNGNMFQLILRPVSQFNRQTLSSFVAQHWTTDRVVLSATGVDHNKFVAEAGEFLMHEWDFEVFVYD